MIQSPTHSRQSSDVSLHEMGLLDHTDHGISMIESREHVSDEEKENKSGNLYYKTLNGGVIRSVRPPNKGGIKYKVGVNVGFFCIFVC